MHRRGYLSGTQFLGGSAVLLLLGCLVLFPETNLFVLPMIQFIGMAHFSAYYIGRTAYAQRVLSPAEFNKFNGVMEVVGQASTFIGCAIGMTVLKRTPISFILLFDALSYFASGCLIWICPKDSIVGTIERRSIGIIQGLKETAEYFKNEKKLLVLLFLAYLPFLGIMIDNYISPVHMVKTLGGEILLFSTSNLVYSIGAISAGLVGMKILKLKDLYVSLRIALVLYLVVFTLAYAQKNTSIYLICFAFLGFSNSFIRICRNTLLMKHVPEQIMGRVNSSFNSIGLLFRVSMITYAATVIEKYGTFNSLLPFLVIYLAGQVFISLRSLKPLT